MQLVILDQLVKEDHHVTVKCLKNVVLESLGRKDLKEYKGHVDYSVILVIVDYLVKTDQEDILAILGREVSISGISLMLYCKQLT